MNYRRVFIENSCVHIIVLSYNRMPIFIDNIDVLRAAFANVSQIYNFEIIAICVLKDHIHMIIEPENIHDYPKIISSIKHSFSKNVGQVCPTYKLKKGYINKREKGIFQHRFYEHTITTQEELNKHIDYIHYNPMKHYGIIPKDWEFSSFHKYVKNNMYEVDWCNFKDKNNIMNMNFE